MVYVCMVSKMLIYFLCCVFLIPSSAWSLSGGEFINNTENVTEVLKSGYEDKICRYVNNRFICECPPEYGETEDVFSMRYVCKACECGRGANCTFEKNGWFYSKKCICPDNSYELNKKCTGECWPNPCYHGKCIESKYYYTCDCDLGYYGDLCESKKPCVTEPCLNGGTCIDIGSGYTCNCADGYTGNDCSVKRGACDPNPCLNGGTCWETFIRRYTCSCRSGYSGDNCEDKRKYCWSSPCENGGTCMEVTNYDGVSSDYECLCPSGYYGIWCTWKETSDSTALKAIFIPLGLVIFAVIFSICLCIVRRQRAEERRGRIIIGNDSSAVIHDPPPFYISPTNPSVVPDHAVFDPPPAYPTLFTNEQKHEQEPPPYRY